MATLLNPFLRALDANGDPVSGGKLAVFQAGTTTAVTTYSDRALSSAQAQPLVANAAGEFAQSFVAAGIYKIRVRDADDNTLYENDNVRIADRPDDPTPFDDVATLLADTGAYAEDAYLVTSEEGFCYQVAESGATDHHVTTAGGAKLYVQSATSEYNVKAFGATGDGATDDTEAIQAALNRAGSYGTIFIPAGTYLCNVTAASNILGAGAKKSILKPFTDAGPVIVLSGGDSLWAKRKISGIEIDGDLATSDGVDFGADSQITGRWAFEDIWFNRCNRAVVKRRGNIGNQFVRCTFHEGNYGYHATGETSPETMHAGNDIFDQCEWHSQALAAFYFNSPTGGTGQVVLNEPIFQGVLGFGVFVKAFANALTPFVMNDGWFEGNHSPSVTIDGASYTPIDIQAKDCSLMVLNRTVLRDVSAENSTIYAKECFCDAATNLVEVDADAVIINANPAIDDTKSAGFSEGAITSKRSGGGQAPVLITHPRTTISRNAPKAGTVLSGQDFANEDAYAFSGSTTRQGRMAPDGTLFDTCCEIAVQNGDQLYGTSTGVTVTSGKYVVWSVDVKAMTSNIGNINLTQAQSIASSLDAALVLNKWVSLAGIAKVATTGSCGLFFTNSTGSTATYRLACYQMVEFSTKQDALSFLRSGVLCSSKQRRHSFGEVPPTTGAWAIGDVVYNTAPTAGGTLGWVCTTAGTPGTWKTFGAIAS